MTRHLMQIAFLVAACVPGSLTGAIAEDRCQPAGSLVSTRHLEPFEEGGLWGYRSAGGETAIAPRFQFGGEFSEHGLAAVFAGPSTGWQLIDASGTAVLSPLPVDNGPDPFIEGLARYREREKIGFFDVRGCVTIEARFDWAMPFSDGLAAVCNGCMLVKHDEHGRIEGGRWGYVDRNGKLIIPLKFDSASGFEAGRANVESGTEAYSIDRTGNRL